MSEKNMLLRFVLIWSSWGWGGGGGIWKSKKYVDETLPTCPTSDEHQKLGACFACSWDAAPHVCVFTFHMLQELFGERRRLFAALRVASSSLGAGVDIHGEFSMPQVCAGILSTANCSFR